MTLPADVRARVQEVDRKRKKNAVPPKLTEIPQLRGLANNRLQGAACVGKGRFFDAEIHGETAEDRAYRHAHARAICRRCPVRTACLDVAAGLNPEQRTGVWGGVVQ